MSEKTKAELKEQIKIMNHNYQAIKEMREKGYQYSVGEIKRLQDELKRTRKALDVAIDALKEQQRWFGVIRVSLISHLNNEYGTVFKSYDADPTVVNVKRANDILNTAIEQITALEQKDVK